MKISLDWLKDFVNVKGSVGKLSDVMTLAGLNIEQVTSIGSDTVFEIEVTTNRPDWLSHLGVAREVHAVTGNTFRPPPFKITPRGKTERVFQISTPDRELCPYYSATLLEGVRWSETPGFMKKRLEACGIRSINFIVDVANYVLLECGQPLHAFDADLLHGTTISARRAKPNEKIVAIDGANYDLTKGDLVIADEKGPVAIGGVMGGKDSEVTEKTRNLLLESAFFAPTVVRHTARRLGLGSESSYRFERRVDPKGVDLARERAVALISRHGRIGSISRAFRSGRLPIDEPKITLKRSEVRRILGVQVPQSKIKSILSRLGLRVSETTNVIRASVPSFRSADLKRPIDLIEEIARVYGYNRIPETLPSPTLAEPTVDPILVAEKKARELCVGLGFQEVITYSMVEESIVLKRGIAHGVRVINPKNRELNLMRPDLLHGLAQTTRQNFFAGQNDFWLFEIGNRYLPNGQKLPKEERLLALVVAGVGRSNFVEGKRRNTLYDLKGAIQHLLLRFGLDQQVTHAPFEDFIYKKGEAISLYKGTHPLGSYGTLSDKVRKQYDLDKPVYYGEMSLERITQYQATELKVKDLPKYPPSPRDLTLILDESIPAQHIFERIKSLGGELVSGIDVLNRFKGSQIQQGKKNLSFRIYYQSRQRTLQNEEVNQLHFSIIDSLNRSFGAELPKGKNDS
ncbi:MAG: phenylalanine--tRNA ligase subunit beta [Candidatus Omnitrophica bacterium]|nr:phenylalanine--tRNA ligase subunit beta [Candidatus Omnitrophota bacterium]